MTFRNRYFFINLLFCTSLLISGICVFTGCTKEVDIDPTAGNGNLPANGTRLTVRATASGFQLPASEGRSDASTRTPVMEGTSTKFQPGDAIGLFCVRRPASGADYISKDIYNLKMTYTEAADGTGSWEPPTTVSAPLVYTDAVTYFAYYPYKDALTTANISNEQTIRDWLKANNTLPTDMLTLDVLAANDLMTATALPSHADDDRGALALNFKHEYALLVVRPMGANCICVPPAGVTAYSYHPEAKSDGWGIDRNVVQTGGEDFKMKINGRKACEMSDGTYRILAEPTTTSSQIGCEYVTFDIGLLPVSASGSSYSDGFKANTCYTLEVHCKDVIGSIERALQPGDFVYQHNGKIEIYPGDGAVDGNGRIPDYANAVGIIVTCDPVRMTDEECKKQGWTHAYVMGLEYLTMSYNREWALSDIQSPLPSVTGPGVGNYMNGYTDTETILALSNLSDYPIFEKIKEYRNSHTVPVGISRSPWFIPSIGQWFDIMTNICGKSPADFEVANEGLSWGTTKYASEMYDKADNQFKKVDGTSLLIKTISDTHIIWTSSSYNSTVAWMFQGAKGAIMLGSLINNYNEHNYEITARPFFAF